MITQRSFALRKVGTQTAKLSEIKVTEIDSDSVRLAVNKTHLQVYNVVPEFWLKFLNITYYYTYLTYSKKLKKACSQNIILC